MIEFLELGPEGRIRFLHGLGIFDADTRNAKAYQGKAHDQPVITIGVQAGRHAKSMERSQVRPEKG